MTAGITSRVRDCISSFSRRKSFSASAVARMIGEPNAAMVQQVFADLLERGEIVKLAQGQYRYLGVGHFWRKPNPVTRRLLRAMHVSLAFSARDLVVLTDATRSFAHKLIKRLVASGDVVLVGMQKSINGQSEATYRVKDRDAFYLKHLIGDNQMRKEKVSDERSV